MFTYKNISSIEHTLNNSIPTDYILLDKNTMQYLEKKLYELGIITDNAYVAEKTYPPIPSDIFQNMTIPIPDMVLQYRLPYKTDKQSLDIRVYISDNAIGYISSNYGHTFKIGLRNDLDHVGILTDICYASNDAKQFTSPYVMDYIVLVFSKMLVLWYAIQKTLLADGVASTTEHSPKHRLFNRLTNSWFVKGHWRKRGNDKIWINGYWKGLLRHLRLNSNGIRKRRI